MQLKFHMGKSTLPNDRENPPIFGGKISHSPKKMLEGGQHPHDDALVVTLVIANH